VSTGVVGAVSNGVLGGIVLEGNSSDIGLRESKVQGNQKVLTTEGSYRRSSHSPGGSIRKSIRVYTL